MRRERRDATWKPGLPIPQKLYRGPVFSVFSGTTRLDDGTLAKRDVVHHQGSVAVVAIREDYSVRMIWQYRIAARKMMLEIPAGRIEANESPEQAAQRELEEETGCTGTLTPGPVYFSSVGFLDEVVHVFFARDLKDVTSKPEPDERIEPKWVSLAEIANGLRTNRYDDSKTIIGLREAPAYFSLNDQMVDDKTLYGWYSDENHKYNTLIWQFPVAIIGLNILAVERLWSSLLLMVVLWLVNDVLLLCVAKHVYHQRCFTKALKRIACRFRAMHPNIPVVSFPHEGGLWPLTRLPVALLLISSLFLLNQVLFIIFLWRR